MPNGTTNQLWASTASNSYTIPAFTDADGDTLTYTAATGDQCNATKGITFVPATHTYSVAAGAGTDGVYTCIIQASDGYTGGTNTATFTITIGSGPVQAALVSQNLYVGKPLSYTVTACTSADGYTPLTQTMSNTGQTGITTPWLTFAGGILTGTPTATGVYSLTLLCTDSKGYTASQAMTITVVANNPPVYSQIPNYIVNTSTTVNLDATTYWTDVETATSALTCTAT